MVWLALAQWLEVLPYGVGSVGLVLILIGSGAHRPLARRLAKATTPTPKKAAAQPAPPPKLDLGLRLAGSGEEAHLEALESLESEPRRREPPPPPAEPETVDAEQAQSFRELQALLAAARERAEDPGSETVEEQEDLQARILRLAQERGAEERTHRQRRKVERELRAAEQPEPEPELEAEPRAEAKPEPEAETKVEPTPEPEPVPEPEPQPEPDADEEATVRAVRARPTRRPPPPLPGATPLVERLDGLRAALEGDDPGLREAAEVELRGLRRSHAAALEALELLSHAAPYLGPECPLDPEQELALETALERLRDD